MAHSLLISETKDPAERFKGNIVNWTVVFKYKL